MRIQRDSVQPLDPPRQEAEVALEALVDAVVDRLGLAVGVARADQEVVGVAQDAAEVELDDVDRLLVGGQRRDRPGQLARGWSSSRSPPRYSLAASMRSATASGTRSADRAPLGDARGGSARRRRRCAACRRTRRRPTGSALERSMSGARAPARSATASRARRRISSGSRHVGRPRAMSPPTMKVRSSSGALACSSRSVSTVYDGPPRSTSSRETSRRSSPCHGQPAQLEPLLRARVARRLLVRRRGHRHEEHAIELRAAPRASARAHQVRRCAGG